MAKASWQRAALKQSAKNPAMIPEVLVLVSNCSQVLVAVPVSHADSECQAAENNPFDFSKLGRLSETHQPVTRIVQSGCLLRSHNNNNIKSNSKLITCASQHRVPFDKRGTKEIVPQTSNITFCKPATSCGSVLTLLVEEPTFRISVTSSLEDKSTFSDLIEDSYPFVSFCCFRVSLPK